MTTEPPVPATPALSRQDADELGDRWRQALPGQEDLGRELLDRYAEPHRRYHTAAHLLSVLRHVDAFAEPDHDLYLVRLGAWFHDAVYAIPDGQVTNEEASARLARRRLGRVGLEQEDLNEVARLVRLTATHVPGPRDPSGELLSDADLAVLGAPPPEYAAYVAAVTEEYARVPRAEFARARFQVLSALRERPLFRTQKGRTLTEQADANLEAECRALADELGIEMEGSDQ